MNIPAGPEEVDDYERLRGELVRAVSRICPPWLASRADDLVQVALLRVLEVRRRSEENAHISSSYLRKAAYSALIDEIRRWRRRREVSLETEDGGIDPAAEPSSPQPDPEEVSAGQELGRAIRECLAQIVRPRRRQSPAGENGVDWQETRSSHGIRKGHHPQMA